MAMAGHCPKSILLLMNESITVKDNGRIPVDTHKEGVPAAELIMTTLHLAENLMIIHIKYLAAFMVLAFPL